MLTRLGNAGCSKLAIAIVLTAISGTAILGMTLELRRTVEVDTTIQSGVGQAIVVGVLRAL
jgi:hypothetical protein